jgi:hypothetical protein
MVTERRRRGQFDRQPVLAQYAVQQEAEDDEEEIGYWRFFGVEHYGELSDYDVHYFVTTARLVGYAAL